MTSDLPTRHIGRPVGPAARCSCGRAQGQELLPVVLYCAAQQAVQVPDNYWAQEKETRGSDRRSEKESRQVALQARVECLSSSPAMGNRSATERQKSSGVSRASSDVGIGCLTLLGRHKRADEKGEDSIWVLVLGDRARTVAETPENAHSTPPGASARHQIGMCGTCGGPGWGNLGEMITAVVLSLRETRC